MSVIQSLHTTLDLQGLHQSNPERFPLLLQSVGQYGPYSESSRKGKGGDSEPEGGSFDLLFALPENTSDDDADYLSLNHGVLSARGAVASRIDTQTPFLDALDRWFDLEREQGPPVSDLPFCGGWILFLGYELAQQVEPTLTLPENRHPASAWLPSALALRCRSAVVVDHRTGDTRLVAENEQAMQSLQSLVDETRPVSPSGATTGLSIDAIQEEAPDRFIEGVERVKAYIRAGDVFQVNLSRRWSASSSKAIDVAALYASLSQVNPAPFAASLRWQGGAVISSSPERLLRVRDGRMDTRPIAGTHPRRPDEDDESVRQALLSHPKERAEHIMLIDLERNDLGRVCVPGTVEVDEMMTLESYAHVHHIVSNISGELRPGVGPGRAIAAAFPGGTITGCPKVRCMEIIAELEGRDTADDPGSGRGAYTGALGYLNLNGDMDLNILIRSMSVFGNSLEFRAGGGIVADSDPQRELEETRAKAQGLINALKPAAL